MNRNPNLKICYDRIIPDNEVDQKLKKHLKHQILSNSKTSDLKTAFEKLDPFQPIPHPYLAIVTQKNWPNGFHLKCRFLEGSPTQRKRVIEKAKIWEQYANIYIDFVETTDEIVRITFQPGQGSWSAVGKDALNEQYFPKKDATMNFGWLEDNTDDDEFERVVLHEFGHALGCVHEHQQPNENLNWDTEAVYAQFSGPPNNWTEYEINRNILQHFSSKGINATLFDSKSIMLYQFPAELFLDHKGTPLNTKLSEMDKTFIASIYPK